MRHNTNWKKNWNGKLPVNEKRILNSMERNKAQKGGGGRLILKNSKKIVWPKKIPEQRVSTK